MGIDRVAAFEMQPQARRLQPVANAPRLTAASCEPLREIQIVDELGTHRPIYVPAERPLTVFVDERELVTLMTLGAAPELLVLGFLFNQRLVKSAAAIESISIDWNRNTAAVKARTPLHDPDGSTAEPRVATGCGRGSVFGGLMSQIDAIELPAIQDARIRQSTLLGLLATMRQHDDIHRNAGSVHSCALFLGGELLVSVEDVGRHNALDTISGWMLLHGVTGGDKTLFTTGRLTSEIVMKSAQSGIPILVSRNGVSAMGYDLAMKLGMTLFGRASNRRFLCYVGAERFDAQPDLHSADPPRATD